MTTPSKRSMERAEEALGPCVNELGACPHCVLSKEVALAFDRLVEEACEVALFHIKKEYLIKGKSDSWAQGNNTACHEISEAIRLKLKGGEDGL